VGQVLLLSLTAALNPTLVAASTMMMLLPSPTKLMLGYLLGALTMSVTLGLVIVLGVHGSGAVKTTQHTLSPAADIALGAISLTIAFVLRSGRVESVVQRRREYKAGGDKPPPRWQRTLSKGSARTTFVIGAALSLPGASYLAGLAEIRRLQPSTAAAIALVVGFNLVMLALLEVPLVCFLIAPEWTPVAIDRAQTWIGERAVRFASRGLAAIGMLLIIKGVIGLLA